MPEENVVSAENNQTESTENKEFIIEKNVLKKYIGTAVLCYYSTIYFNVS